MTGAGLIGSLTSARITRSYNSRIAGDLVYLGVFFAVRAFADWKTRSLDRARSAPGRPYRVAVSRVVFEKPKGTGGRLLTSTGNCVFG